MEMLTNIFSKKKFNIRFPFSNLQATTGGGGGDVPADRSAVPEAQAH
jgi:hypothetical protein